MLTHVHKVVHLVVSTFEQGLKRWRGVGYLSPSLARFSTSKKIKCIFSIAPEKNLEKLLEWFPLKTLTGR